MRVFVPGVQKRRRVVQLLESYFDTHDEHDLDLAVLMLAEFYHLPLPRVSVHTRFQARIWGDTDPRGNIRLTSPETWQRRTTENDADSWVRFVLHEVAHWVFWSNAEPKAEAYAERFTEGL